MSLLLLFNGGSGATEETQSVAGASTPAGAVTLEAQRPEVGSVGSSSDIVMEPQLVMAGAVTDDGALTRQPAINLAGASTPTSTLGALRSIILALAGALTSSAALVRQTQAIRVRIFVPEADLGPIDPAIGVTGDLASTGSPTKSTATTMDGDLTPTGAVGAVKAALLSLAGALQPTASLATQKISGVVQLALSGAVTFSSDMTRDVGQRLARSLSLSGGPVKDITYTLAGAIAATGSVVASAIGPLVQAWRRSNARPDTTRTTARGTTPQ